LKESDLAYSTIATLCGRLVEKGLLRQRAGESDRRDRRTVSYVYTPRISEDEFVRTAVTQQLDRLLAHYPELVCASVTQHGQQGRPSGSREDTDDRANMGFNPARPEKL
jgi:predicted transcriptional regulator